MIETGFPVIDLIAALSVPSSYATEEQNEKLRLLKSVFPVGDPKTPTYVPHEWLFHLGLKPDQLPANHPGLTWEELEATVGRDSLWSDLYQWRKDQGFAWKRWFVTLDYGATGEGHTMMFATVGGYSKAEALATIVVQEGYWWGIGLDLHETVPDNHITRMLVSAALRKDLENAGPRAEDIRLFYHVNYS